MWKPDPANIITAEKRASERRRKALGDIDTEHDRRAEQGATFAVSGYGEIPLEGSLRTQAVLLALKDTARDMKASSVNLPLLVFTDRSGIDHAFTPDQLIELVDAGKRWMQALHQAKRALKALDPIPSDFTDDLYWP